MSSSDVSDLEEEKKKMKKKEEKSDSEENSEAEKAKKKKKKEEKRKREEKKRKKKADSDSDDSDSEAENKKAKKKKKKAKEEVEDGVELDDEGRLDLGRDKTMDVREFKGKLLIDIREFYTDRSDGKKKPGKKGICLSTVEYESMKRGLAYIDRKIKKMS